MNTTTKSTTTSQFSQGSHENLVVEQSVGLGALGLYLGRPAQRRRFGSPEYKNNILVTMGHGMENDSNESSVSGCECGTLFDRFMSRYIWFRTYVTN